MEQKHTPGPWYAVPNNAFIDISTTPGRYDGKSIADVCSSGHSFDKGDPGHADNTAQIRLKKTAAYSALLDINGERKSQKEQAEWLEDYADFITGFDKDGEIIQATKAAAAIRKITIEANSSADFEDNDFSGKRSVMESVEAKTKDIMPVAFEFKCVPYEGLKVRPFKLRMSIITGDRPVLVLRIVQIESVQEDIANEFRDLLVDKFKDSQVETFIGSFHA